MNFYENNRKKAREILDKINMNEIKKNDILMYYFYLKGIMYEDIDIRKAISSMELATTLAQEEKQIYYEILCRRVLMEFYKEVNDEEKYHIQKHLLPILEGNIKM